MKREIKFRAWDSKEKVFVLEGFNVLGEALLFGALEMYCIETDDGNDQTLRLNDIIISQYTGLKDRKGKEIYEGDILLYIGTNISSMSVSFNDGQFVGEGPFNTLSLIDYINADDFQSIEVIGNIYENINE